MKIPHLKLSNGEIAKRRTRAEPSQPPAIAAYEYRVQRTRLGTLLVHYRPHPWKPPARFPMPPGETSRFGLDRCLRGVSPRGEPWRATVIIGWVGSKRTFFKAVSPTAGGRRQRRQGCLGWPKWEVSTAVASVGRAGNTGNGRRRKGPRGVVVSRTPCNEGPKGIPLAAATARACQTSPNLRPRT